MKAIVALLLLEVVTLCTCIPLESSSQPEYDDKSLNSQVRQKRGWGYQTAWVPSHVFGPSKTIITSPSAVAVSSIPTTTHYVVPQRVATAVAVPSGHHTESIVYSSGPDHTYYVHQKHHPHTYYYHYPTTHYVATSPLITTWP